jgi:hypothetical protein
MYVLLELFHVEILCLCVYRVILCRTAFLTLMESGLLIWFSNGLRAQQPGFDSQQFKIFLFTASRPTLGPTQWVPGGSFPGDKAVWA